ncbi:hypothetical protein ELI_3600 [Eubacterium callanderi]|uniref:Uncharacterized protein n=1 Tax=Eubacterium callanderi TaxID=53442 RepID=E3GG18_9FIRM|nr:hypothetical protein ELI_3600 [Eubacterium callanderi]
MGVRMLMVVHCFMAVPMVVILASVVRVAVCMCMFVAVFAHNNPSKLL